MEIIVNESNIKTLLSNKEDILYEIVNLDDIIDKLPINNVRELLFWAKNKTRLNGELLISGVDIITIGHSIVKKELKENNLSQLLGQRQSFSNKQQIIHDICFDSRFELYSLQQINHHYVIKFKRKK